MGIFYFGDWWHWPSFYLYIFIGFAISFMIKKSERTYVNANNGLVKKKNYNVKSHLLYLLVFLLLVILATIRSVEVGGDVVGYLNRFINKTSFNFDLQSTIILRQSEPLYELFIYTLRKFTTSPIIYFLLIYSFISYSLIKFLQVFIDRKIQFIVLSLLMLGYVYNFSAVRSGIAEGFILLALCNLKEKKTVRAILLTIIGAQFHYSVYVNIAFIIFYKMFTGKLLKKKGAIITAFVLTILASNFIVVVLRGVLESTKYRYYLSHQGTFLGNAFIIILAVIVLLIFNKLRNRLGEENVLIYVAVFMGILVPSITLTGAYRIPNIYLLPRILMWAYLAQILVEKVKTDKYLLLLTKISIYGATFGYFLFKMIRIAEGARIMPYEFFF